MSRTISIMLRSTKWSISSMMQRTAIAGELLGDLIDHVRDGLCGEHAHVAQDLGAKLLLGPDRFDFDLIGAELVRGIDCRRRLAVPGPAVEDAQPRKPGTALVDPLDQFHQSHDIAQRCNRVVMPRILVSFYPSLSLSPPVGLQRRRGHLNQPNIAQLKSSKIFMCPMYSGWR